MRGYRLRIALLSLGVLFGYGDAVMHVVHHRGHGFRHCRDHAGRDFGWGADYDRGRPDHPHAEPAKP